MLVVDGITGEPVAGAVMLFAALFNIFQFVLHVLMMFSSGDD